MLCPSREFRDKIRIYSKYQYQIQWHPKYSWQQVGINESVVFVEKMLEKKVYRFFLRRRRRVDSVTVNALSANSPEVIWKYRAEANNSDPVHLNEGSEA